MVIVGELRDQKCLLNTLVYVNKLFVLQQLRLVLSILVNQPVDVGVLT